MADLIDDIASDKYNRFCHNGFADYKGDLPCAYNVARAFVEAKRHLDRNFSKNSKDWQWRHVHSNEYAYAPWSLTPLKFLWHRKVPTAGNGHTVHVAKYSIAAAVETKLFNAKHAANYKQVIEIGPNANKGLYSIDTGNNGNVFQGHYFTMNSDHLQGKLQTMKVLGSKELGDVPKKTLTIQRKNQTKKPEL